MCNSDEACRDTIITNDTTNCVLDEVANSCEPVDSNVRMCDYVPAHQQQGCTINELSDDNSRFKNIPSNKSKHTPYFINADEILTMKAGRPWPLDPINWGGIR